jgi:hypothetical protein
MKAVNVQVQNDIDRLSKRKADRFRQALARRQIQELREEKLLKGWLTEVWEESSLLTELSSSMHLH